MTRPAEAKDDLAGITARGTAYLIDCVCAFAIFVSTQLALFLPIRSAVGITDDWFRSGWNTEAYTLLTISIPVWLYFAILESSRWQASLGKRLLGLRVVGASSRSRIGLSRSLVRTVVKLVPWELAHIGNNLPEPIWYSDEPELRMAFLFSGLLMTGYVVLLFVDARRRVVHDRVAGTVVTRRGRRS